MLASKGERARRFLQVGKFVLEQEGVRERSEIGQAAARVGQACGVGWRKPNGAAGTWLTGNGQGGN